MASKRNTALHKRAHRRVLLTGEPEQAAAESLRTLGADDPLVPTAGLGQEGLEESIFDFLTRRIGPHVPADRGGLLGIRRVRPSRDCLVVEVDDVATAVRHLGPHPRFEWPEKVGAWTGDLGDSWSSPDDGPQYPYMLTAQIVLNENRGEAVIQRCGGTVIFRHTKETGKLVKGFDDRTWRAAAECTHLAQGYGNYLAEFRGAPNWGSYVLRHIARFAFKSTTMVLPHPFGEVLLLDSEGPKHPDPLETWWLAHTRCRRCQRCQRSLVLARDECCERCAWGSAEPWLFENDRLN